MKSFLILATGLLFAAPGVAQELEPQTVPLRIDNTGHSNVLQLMIRCGPIMRPVGMAEAGVVTDLRLRVTQLCREGDLVAEAKWVGWVTPLEQVVAHDREGLLGGLLLCIADRDTRLKVYTSDAIPSVCRDPLEQESAVREPTDGD